jgi:hypothetical protein
MLLKKKHQVVNGLIQSGYKSILCEEDPYLRQLVGYIHLNPLLRSSNEWAWHQCLS